MSVNSGGNNSRSTLPNKASMISKPSAADKNTIGRLDTATLTQPSNSIMVS